MSGKKASNARVKQLKAEVKKLQAQLAKTEAKVQRWKSAASSFEQVASESRARAKKLAKRWEKAARPPASPTETVPAAEEAPQPAVPDATWTVAQLRAEAKARQLAGFSRMTKAELLNALT